MKPKINPEWEKAPGRLLIDNPNAFKCLESGSKPKHVCEPAKFCMCSSIALEPNEDCPVHGYPHPREVFRCLHCGRFMKHTHET